MMKRWMYGTVFLAFISVYSNPFDCDFEKDPCSWSLEGFRRISYNQSNSTGGMNDDKPRNGKEWCLYFDATNESYAALKSKPTTIIGLQCLNFWYRFSGQEKSQIQIIVQDIGGGNDSVIWEKSDIWYTGWLLATVELDVQTSSMVTILIRGKTGRSHSIIEIDDIVVKLASCLDCNFLNGLCSWKGNGCTFATDELYHAVMECKSPLDQSILSSDVEISPGEKCLSFKYQTKDFQRENVYIDVQSYYEKQWSTVWKSGWQQQIQGWKEIGAEINLPNKSSITIRFVHRNCSNVTYYISSISLKKQSCTESKTTFAEFPTSIPNVTVIDTTVATSTAARTVTTSTYSANETTNAPSTSTSVTATITPKATIEAYSSDTMKNTVDTSINITSADVANSSTTAPVVTNTFAMPNNSAKEELSTHMPIVIGCVVTVVAVVFVAVCFFRRIRDSVASKKSANDVRISSERNRGMSSKCNCAPNVRLSLERSNRVLETAYNNARDQEVHPGQSEIPYRSVAEKTSVSSLVNELKHNNLRNIKHIKHPLQSKTQTCQNVGRDGNTHYDTTKPMPDDTYNSTITCGYRSFDVTYDHTHFKGNTDNTYDHIHFTPENAYDTTI